MTTHHEPPQQVEGWAVWKFDLPWEDVVTVEMPCYAQILHVGLQPDGIGGQALKLWARVLPTAPTAPNRFRVAGTGHPLHHPDHPDFDFGEHIGSVVFPNGSLVFHVFEEASPF